MELNSFHAPLDAALKNTSIAKYDQMKRALKAPFLLFKLQKTLFLLAATAPNFQWRYAAHRFIFNNKLMF